MLVIAGRYTAEATPAKGLSAILDDMEIHLTDDAEADRLLSDNPLALMIGMLLDQQVC